MESTDLTCAKCAATWKLIKASADRVICPYCKAPFESTASPAPAESKPAETTPIATISPPEVATVAVPVPPTQSTPDIPVAPSPEEPSIPATVRAFDVPDTDDPGLVDDYDDQVDPRRRRHGMNPVAKTILILVLLIFLAPVALFIILLAVCAIMIVAR